MGGYESLKSLQDGGYTLVCPSAPNGFMRVWGRVNPDDSVLGGRVGGWWHRDWWCRPAKLAGHWPQKSQPV